MSPDAIQSIDEKTLLLAVSFRRFGLKRTMSDDEYQVDGDKTLTSATRIRIDSPTLRSIEAFDSKVQKDLAKKTLPALIKSGLYRVATTNLSDVIGWLQQRADARAGLVEAFKVAYPVDRDRTITRLAGLANLKDYPTPDVAALEFGMSWRLLAGGVPAQLAAVDEALDQQERQRYRQHLQEAAESYRSMLRVAAADYVAKLVDQMDGKTKDGKKRRVYASAFENLREFVDGFPGRNVADDTTLAAMLAEARSTLESVNVETVRDDESVRAAIAARFTAMSRGLEVLVAEAGGRKRKITLED